jgi:hypothetical protein
VLAKKYSRPSISPGRGGLVVTDTECQTHGQRCLSRAATVPLPTPEGPDRTVSVAGAVLAGAVLAGPVVAGTVLAGTVLAGAVPVLPGTVLPGTVLPGTVLPGTVLPETELPGTGTPRCSPRSARGLAARRCPAAPSLGWPDSVRYRRRTRPRAHYAGLLPGRVRGGIQRCPAAP